MDYVEIDVFGSPFLKRKLRATGHRAADLEPVLRSIAGDMRGQAKRAFDSRGLTSGSAWPPLQPDTIARKLRDKNPKVKANATKILHATERLRDSLTNRADEDHIERVTNNVLEFGTEVPYAHFHQDGTRDMKARPPIRMYDFQRGAAKRKVERWITTGLLT